LDNDLNMLAAIGLRTSFDIASEQLGVAANLTFEKKLDALLAEGFIEESGLEQLSVLVEVGSASAHRGWIPNAAQLITLMQLLENFIYKAFIAPVRLKHHAAEIAKIMGLVPKRPPSEKVRRREQQKLDEHRREIIRQISNHANLIEGSS
jgi:hypothetical protein